MVGINVRMVKLDSYGENANWLVIDVEDTQASCLKSSRKHQIVYAGYCSRVDKEKDAVSTLLK